VSSASDPHENFCVFCTCDFHRLLTAPAAAPPSAAHPTDPTPQLAARHPPVTTAPTTPPTISAWCVRTHRDVADPPRETADVTFFHADPIDSNPVGSDLAIGLLSAYEYAAHCCGDPRSITGSTDTNRPINAS
jgi:hypothetical protein